MLRLQTKLDYTSKDAATLQTTTDTYDNLAAQTVALGGSVDGISSAWKAVEADMNAAIAEINDAMIDSKTADYTAVYNDLVDALNEWNATYAACINLEINVQGNPAQLAIPMTSDQVSAALSANTSVDFVTYINNFPEYSPA